VKNMRYRVVLEPQAEGGYTVFVPQLPDVVSEGETREEALNNVKDAIEGYLTVLKETNWPVPKVEEETIEVGS